ncbi:MAG: AMP-binding protein [Bacteroidales bacterium]|nr:AMP-binding protein [Bacteroidales bacterium]
MITASERIAIINGKARVTFKQMLQHVTVFADMLDINEKDRVLIFSENREGWIYSLYSIWTRKGIVVPVDASSTVDDVVYIIKDCKPSAVLVSSSRRTLLDQALEKASVSIAIYNIDECENASFDNVEPAKIGTCMQDTCLICYTSGTTGSPKGVMLTFGNVIANVEAVSKYAPIFNEDRRTLILLPLHHVLPLVGTCVMPFVCGGGVAICPSLSGPRIMESLQNGQVGIMIGVPRLWQMLYRGIRSKIDANAITRSLYKICEFLQCRALSRIVFSSVRKKMGGKIDYLVSGGAALDRDTAIGLKTLGLDVLEGYGMTEAAPMIAFTRPGDIRPGCVGKAIHGCEVQIIDGEICARGINVMQGYYGRPEETANVIDKDGFLHTGDLGSIDKDGRITITGRRKEIIILSNGKNVNPNELEEKLEHYSIVKEAAVTFADDKLVAIVVPTDEVKENKSATELLEMVRAEVISKYNESVAQYKKLARFVIHDGELPRTRMEKLQRFKLQDLFRDLLPSS